MHPFLLYYNYNEALHYNAFITRKLPSPSHAQENLRHLLQLKAKGANTIMHRQDTDTVFDHTGAM